MKTLERHIFLMILFDTLAHPVSRGTGRLLSYLVNTVLEADFWESLQYLSKKLLYEQLSQTL